MTSYVLPQCHDLDRQQLLDHYVIMSCEYMYAHLETAARELPGRLLTTYICTQKTVFNVVSTVV